jgi:hypothetical protein
MSLKYEPASEPLHVSVKKLIETTMSRKPRLWVRTMDGPALQGYLAHKKQPPRRTLQEPDAYGSRGVLWG